MAVRHRGDNDERFWAKVEKGPGCWVWTASLSHGYGQFWLSGTRETRRKVLAHRYAYEHLIGSVPEGMQLDHLCRNRACVNPAHLEAVTQVENLLRGYGPAAVNARMVRCSRGHPLEGENLYVSPQGKRGCRACRRAANDRVRARSVATREQAHG